MQSQPDSQAQTLELLPAPPPPPSHPRQLPRQPTLPYLTYYITSSLSQDPTFLLIPLPITSSLLAARESLLRAASPNKPSWTDKLHAVLATFS
jgi:hypothetical protein